MSFETSRSVRFVRKIFQIVQKKMKTIWTTPFENAPTIFVCNHDRSFGPIAMCAHFELYKDVSPWINSEVLSAKEFPEYVRSDYWWNPDKWYSKILGHTLAYVYALFLPSLLRGTACIPVYHDTRVMSTMRGSIEALKEGRHIVLFPEHPSGFGQYDAEVVNGFVSVAKLMYRRTNQCINFYPTFIDWQKSEIRIAEPIAYDPDMNFALLTKSISDAVEKHFIVQN